MASPPFVPKLNLPSARSDWGDASLTTPARMQQMSAARYDSRGLPSVAEASGHRNPWPGLEERFWQPPADAAERGLGGFMSARVNGVGPAVSHRNSAPPTGAYPYQSVRGMPSQRASPPSARPPNMSQRYGEANPSDSKENAGNTESSSWWFSSSKSVPSLNCSGSAPPPKERYKEETRHCTAKGIDRQCNHLTQDCEDNIKELLFRDAEEEVEERPLKPPVDAFAECSPKADRPNTLKSTLQTWSVPERTHRAA